MNMKYIIALDEGTTSTRAVLFNTHTQKIDKVKNMFLSKLCGLSDVRIY